MKNKIFLYLFLFAVLFIIYQYMNEKTIFKSQEAQISNLEAKIQAREDSLKSHKNSISDLNYFTLSGNENAQNYFGSFGNDANTVQDLVANKIYDQNVLEGSNPLIPFEGMNGEMKINRIQFLNHKWIIADFTDGVYWGEMILDYSLNSQNEITLNVISSLIYPKN
ncbi:hydrolase [Aequorivita echinoideorum]|uniref:Hydrolase n=1 Tax=Aequorivita echinoideorum TaxID=1549647 RepID=A0ABS5S6U4_9FLAO|nr:hydrolase [Aequorivita echinoideorum]MBT0608927.1 hydrolase [Aequorivita echinoideorum]